MTSTTIPPSKLKTSRMVQVDLNEGTYDLVQAVRRMLNTGRSDGLTFDGIVFGLAYREFVEIAKRRPQ